MIKPIYHELSEKLEDYITTRNLSGRLPGLSILSKEFGVHQVTMSKAVKILEKKGLLTINGTRGTFINEKSRNRPQHKVIGVIGLEHIRERDNFIAKLAKSIKTSGYAPIGITASKEMLAKNPRLLSHFPVDGFMFCCSSLTSNIAKHLHQENIPFVVCNRRPNITWASTLDYDHAAIFGDTLNYLKSLGHRRIAYISPATPTEYQYHSKWMYSIIQNVVQDDFNDNFFYNLPLKWQELVQQEKLSYEINRMLHYFAYLPKPPTAIITPSESGVEIIKQLEKYGLQCPRDISIFFYGTSINHEDDIAHSFFDYDELWLTGVKMLLGIFNHKLKQPVSRLLKMPVVPGSTAGKVPTMDRFKTAISNENIPSLTKLKPKSRKRKKQRALIITN